MEIEFTDEEVKQDLAELQDWQEAEEAYEKCNEYCAFFGDKARVKDGKQTN